MLTSNLEFACKEKKYLLGGNIGDRERDFFLEDLEYDLFLGDLERGLLLESDLVERERSSSVSYL